MYKVILADDEPLTLIGLQSMIDWNDYNMQICGTAKNGEATLDLIEKEKADIVIIDIKMPRKTGLEAALISKERFGDIPVFVFLTSFEEIEFLHEAIRVSAVDYLLKMELTKENLERALEKAVDRLKILKPEGENTGGVEKQTMIDNFFLCLLYDVYDSRKKFEIQKNKLQLETEIGTSFLVCYCEIINTSQDDITLYSSAVKMVQETINKFLENYLVNLDMNHFALILCIKPDEHKNAEQHIQSALTEAALIVKNYFSVQLISSVGFFVDDLFTISQSFSASRQGAKDTYNQSAIHFAAPQNEGYKTKTILEIKQYIKNNIQKKISLVEIADAFCLSPNYFSQFFAKNAGITITEFITNEKISLAKKMLCDKNAMIYEVAESLGFESAFYFSRVFKKITGIPPKEYQKNACTFIDN